MPYASTLAAKPVVIRSDGGLKIDTHSEGNGMEISPVGLLVCAALLVVGWYMRAPLIVGLLASMAFGSTSLVTLTALGGSSPLIYTFFAGLLVAAVALRKRFLRELSQVIGTIRPLWILFFLMVYAVVGAWLFPRLFVGQATVFVQPKSRFGVVEAPLAPVSGNISQTGYFILGGLTAIALCIVLLNIHRLADIRRGLLLWCGLHTGMGVIDLFDKLSGVGDLLLPIRTATYAMLTDTNEAGFARIAGAFSEASAFAGVSLGCLCFAYTYWRRTGSRYAAGLSLTLLVLLLLSTSSTAYVGLAVLSVPVLISLVRSIAGRRLRQGELAVMAIGGLALIAIMGATVYDQRVTEPFQQLIDTAVLNKHKSTSGQERSYWNAKSIEALGDTVGLGVGFGSSRASSWPIAVLSQLGLVGAVLMAALLAVVVRGLGPLKRWVDDDVETVAASVRASALGSLIGGSLTSGTADPGIFFFISLAVIAATRMHAGNAMHAANHTAPDRQPSATMSGTIAGQHA